MMGELLSNDLTVAKDKQVVRHGETISRLHL
jgi:hypothetical protein